MALVLVLSTKVLAGRLARLEKIIGVGLGPTEKAFYWVFSK